MNVAVLGASRKPHRYSYQAVKLLAEKGHTPLPVHPVVKDIDGIRVYASLREIKAPIHTVSVYLSAGNSDKVADDILASGAKRVVFNPGAENPQLAARLAEQGVEVIEACTLVMLRTDQF